MSFFKISKNKKNAFLSHVPRILQSKNQVPRPKGVLCSSETDRQESENGPKIPFFKISKNKKKNQMQQNKMKFNRVYVKRHPLDCKCEQKQPPRVPWLRAVASRPQPQLKDKRDKICECPPNVPSGLTWRKRERIREEAIERQRPIYRCL